MQAHSQKLTLDEKKQGSIGELSPATVCLQALDNQWFSDTALDGIKKRNHGVISSDDKREKEILQKNELFRALVNAKQIVINRAHLMNNAMLENLYRAETDAFAYLLSQETIVPYLFNERHPCKKPLFHINEKMFDAWCNVYSKANSKCLRLSWDNKRNAELIDRKLTYKFHAFGESLASISNAHSHALGRNLGLRDTLLSDFTRFSRTVGHWFQDMTRTFDDKGEPRKATRNEFYKKFITPDDCTVDTGNIAPNKQFSLELKKLFDLKYSVNFSDAITRHTMTPADSMKRSALAEELAIAPADRNPISEDDFSAAIIEFYRKSIAEIVFDSECAILNNLNLADIIQLRHTDAHEKYATEFENLLKSIDSMKNSQDLLEHLGDYKSSVHSIFERYGNVLHACASIYEKRVNERRRKVKFYAGITIEVLGKSLLHFCGDPTGGTLDAVATILPISSLVEIFDHVLKGQIFPVKIVTTLKADGLRNDVPEFQQNFFTFNVKKATDNAEGTFKELYKFANNNKVQEVECVFDNEATINEIGRE